MAGRFRWPWILYWVFSCAAILLVIFVKCKKRISSSNYLLVVVFFFFFFPPPPPPPLFFPPFYFYFFLFFSPSFSFSFFFYFFSPSPLLFLFNRVNRVDAAVRPKGRDKTVNPLRLPFDKSSVQFQIVYLRFRASCLSDVSLVMMSLKQFQCWPGWRWCFKFSSSQDDRRALALSTPLSYGPSVV